MLNRDEATKIIDAYNELKAVAEGIACRHLEITKGYVPNNFAAEGVELYDGHIVLDYSEGTSGCWENNCYECPLDTMWNENWEAELRASLEAEKKAKENAALEKSKLEDLRQIECEKKLLQKLKAKYPEEERDSK